jgi:hypothetical protein
MHSDNLGQNSGAWEDRRAVDESGSSSDGDKESWTSNHRSADANTPGVERGPSASAEFEGYSFGAQFVERRGDTEGLMGLGAEPDQRRGGRDEYGRDYSYAPVSPSPSFPPSLPSPARFDNVVYDGATGLAHRVVVFEYIYGILGLLLGLACILGGVILGLRGVTGSTSWTADALGLSSNINDATPGVVLFVVGIFLVWITKPKLHFKNSPRNY